MPVGVVLILIAAVALFCIWLAIDEANRQKYLRDLRENPWPTLLLIYHERLMGPGRYAWLSDMRADERALFEKEYIAFGVLKDPNPNSRYGHGSASFLNVTEKGRQKLLELLNNGTFNEESFEKRERVAVRHLRQLC